MRRLGIVSIALAMALTGCGGMATHAAPGTATAAGVSAATGIAPGTYTVSAIVESYSDGTAQACRTLYLTGPGDCASALPISHLGSARLPFSQDALTRGAYLTPTMRLTGTWTGSSLALTIPPSRAAAATQPLMVWSASRPPPLAQMAAGSPTAAGLRDQQVLMAALADLQHRGILVMENGFNQTGLYILVAVADPATVDLLHSRYKVQEIDAWLQPQT